MFVRGLVNLCTVCSGGGSGRIGGTGLGTGVMVGEGTWLDAGLMLCLGLVGASPWGFSQGLCVRFFFLLAGAGLGKQVAGLAVGGGGISFLFFFLGVCGGSVRGAPRVSCMSSSEELSGRSGA